MAIAQTARADNSGTFSSPLSMSIASGTRAVLVFTYSTTQVTACTIAGGAATEVESLFMNLGAEISNVYQQAWLRTDGSIPTGSQNISVTGPSAGTVLIIARTYSAAADVEVVDSATHQSASEANPSVNLALGTRSCAVAMVFGSGQDAVSGISPLAGWTSAFELDAGTVCLGSYDVSSGATGTFAAGVTQTADDIGFVVVALAEPVGGGSSYNVSLSESGSAADTVSSVLNAVRSLAEAASASDTPSALLVAASAISESGSATDVPSALAVLPSAIAESGNATDAVAMALQLLEAVSDMASALDSLTSALDAVAELTDAGSAQDAPSAAAVIADEVDETGSADDSVSAGAASYSVDLAEAGSAADSPSAQADLVGSIDESGAASDVLSALADLIAAMTETASPADAYSTSGATYAVDMIETGNLADLLNAAMTAAAAFAESGAATDSMDALAVLNGALAEAGAAIDALALTGDVTVSIVETADAQDLVNALSSQLGGAAVITVPYRTRTIVIAAARRTITIH